MASSPNASTYYDEFVDPLLPTKNSFVIRVEHLGRYLFAKKFVQQFSKGVIYDIACGDGYGVRILKDVAKKVYGFDNKKEFLDIAKTYKGENIEYVSCDLEKESLLTIQKKYSLPTSQVIVCLEAIEHLANGERLLHEFYQLLSHGGYLILSTPNVLLEPKKHGVSKNAFHKKIYSKEEMVELLHNNHFVVEKIYGQAMTNILYHKFRFLMGILNTLTEHIFPLIYLGALCIGMPAEVDIEKSYAMVFIAKKAKPATIEK